MNGVVPIDAPTLSRLAMRPATFALVLGGLLVATGCEPTSPAPGDADTAEHREVGEDVGDTSDVGDADATGETSDAPDGDGFDGGDAACAYQSDCADDAICHDSACRPAPTCSGPSGWKSCADRLSELDTDLAERAVCHDGHCRVACATDDHCPAGEICTDNGSCRSFDGTLDAPPPGDDESAPLRAGVGETLLAFPVGLSLGGYGSRADSGDGRFADALAPSHGQMHGLHARAVALDNGTRQLVLLRLPMIFTTGAFHEAVARRLQEETGKNWRGSLLVSSTHTHSGPARFYHLPRETLLPLGMLGTDEYHDQVFAWLADSAADAALRALDNRRPASLGIDVVEGFDIDDALSSDRWEQTPRFDDNRLLAIRVDAVDEETGEGSPMAVAVSLGTHGTIHSGSYANGDAPAGFEHGLEEALAEHWDEPVPVLFFNQAGGTMSPRGDGLDHDEPQRFEKLGAEFAERAMPELTSMATSRDVELGGATHRFPISYERLGYEPGEWGDETLDTARHQYTWGGLKCTSSDDQNPSTYDRPEDLECLGIHRLLYNHPPSLFLRSQISAFRIADHTLVTAPGELAMETSWQIVRRLRDDHGLDPAEVWTFGYAQDHQFYLMPTNLRGEAPPFPGYRGPEAPEDYPDRTFSYLQGGYEPGMSFWGWRFGDYLVDRASRAVAKLRDDSFERELPATYPHQFSAYGREDFPVDPSPPEAVGDFAEQPPEVVERFETIEVAWVGGDPKVEMPQAPLAELQRRRDDGTFSTVRTDRLRPYTNREPVMLTRRRRRDGRWEWVVRWEELRDFPTGTYRFRVEGHHRDGERTSYTATSRSFEVVPSEKLEVSFQLDGRTLRGELAYPADEPTSFGGPSRDPGQIEGNFRLRDPDVPTGVPAPLAPQTDVDPAGVTVIFERNGTEQLRLTGPDIDLSSTEKNRSGRDVPTTIFSTPPAELDSGDYSVTVTVRDTHGNRGSATSTVTLPPR